VQVSVVLVKLKTQSLSFEIIQNLSFCGIHIQQI